MENQVIDTTGVPASVADELKLEMEKIQSEQKAQEETPEQKLQREKEEVERVARQKEMDEAARVAAESKGIEKTAEEIEAERLAEEQQTPEQKAQKEKEEKTDWREILAEKKAKEEEEKEKAEWEELKNSKIFQTLKRGLKSGKKAEEVIKELGNVTSVNVDEITEEEIFANVLRQEGFDEDEISYKYDSFKDQPESIKKTFIENKREELRKAQDSVFSESEEFKKTKESFTTALAYIDDAAEKLKGVEIGGIKITKSLQAEIFAKAETLLPAFRRGNAVQANEAFEMAVRDTMYPHIVKEREKFAASEAKKEAFKEIHNPDAKGTPIANGTAKTKTETQVQDDALQEHMDKMNNPFGLNRNN